MLNKCTKIGFLVCLLVLLIILCVWRHTGDIKANRTAASAETVVSHMPDQPADRDQDGIPDQTEVQYHLNPALADTDADNKKDGEEGVKSDRDGDGIIDALESALDDSDLDGVVDELDAENTNPDNDSDGDGYNNGLETSVGSNPLDIKNIPADWDKDGIPDSIDADKKPITFTIIKNEDHVSLQGTFADVLQAQTLKEALDDGKVTYKNGVITQEKYLGDKGMIGITRTLLPTFLSLYKNGQISFRDGTLEVNGVVAHTEDKDAMEKLLVENAGLIHYVNDTQVVEPPKVVPPKVEAVPTPAPEPNATSDKVVDTKVPDVSDQERQEFMSEIHSTLLASSITFKTASANSRMSALPWSKKWEISF